MKLLDSISNYIEYYKIPRELLKRDNLYEQLIYFKDNIYRLDGSLPHKKALAKSVLLAAEESLTRAMRDVKDLGRMIARSYKREIPLTFIETLLFLDAMALEKETLPGEVSYKIIEFLSIENLALGAPPYEIAGLLRFVEEVSTRE